MLTKQGYNLFYYNSEKPSLEMDFFVRDADSLIPVEVKANDGATASLNNLLKEDKYPDVKYGIKLGYKNIGFNGKFYTFPYFLTFLLKRFVAERKNCSNNHWPLFGIYIGTVYLRVPNKNNHESYHNTAGYSMEGC